MKSPLCWLGGKYRLARKIARLMPEHHCYCEVFCGAAHVFFARQPSPIEVLNDINGELINFWRQLGRQPQKLKAHARFALYSRAEFDRQARLDPGTLDEAARAWRFLYINRTCFGGKIKSPTFCASKNGSGNVGAKLARATARLGLCHQRLKTAVIECLPWQECIARYDSKDTLFYLDPPYDGCERDYGMGIWSRADFARLAATLAQIRGSFLLSINDTPAMRRLFAGFRLAAEFDVAYSVNDRGRVRRGELVFSNVEAEATADSGPCPDEPAPMPGSAASGCACP